MLIQPYIENSIWHGLMPKKEGGIVLVNLIALDDDILSIEIIDNGIGRSRANTLKSKNATERKSYGMQITSDRVQIIKQLYNIDTKIQIIDLYDAEKAPKGTKVVIEIPIR
jgi:LytS/YehU family sensor histidine kinase